MSSGHGQQAKRCLTSAVWLQKGRGPIFRKGGGGGGRKSPLPILEQFVVLLPSCFIELGSLGIMISNFIRSCYFS